MARRITMRVHPPWSFWSAGIARQSGVDHALDLVALLQPVGELE